MCRTHSKIRQTRSAPRVPLLFGINFIRRACYYSVYAHTCLLQHSYTTQPFRDGILMYAALFNSSVPYSYRIIQLHSVLSAAFCVLLYQLFIICWACVHQRSPQRLLYWPTSVIARDHKYTCRLTFVVLRTAALVYILLHSANCP
jgi:hypothetical protein